MSSYEVWGYAPTFVDDIAMWVYRARHATGALVPPMTTVSEYLQACALPSQQYLLEHSNVVLRSTFNEADVTQRMNAIKLMLVTNSIKIEQHDGVIYIAGSLCDFVEAASHSANTVWRLQNTVDMSAIPTCFEFREFVAVNVVEDIPLPLRRVTIQINNTVHVVHELLLRRALRCNCGAVVDDEGDVTATAVVTATISEWRSLFATTSGVGSRFANEAHGAEHERIFEELCTSLREYFIANKWLSV